MKKFAVILSGCGHKDGSEITESVSSLIALSEAKTEYQIFAPEIIVKSTNHITGESEDSRSILSEAARIARGKIHDLSELNSSEFDGLVFPGGFGAALHLCTFATEGAKCKVLPKIEKIILNFHNDNKPIGAICIAPALIARVLGKFNVTLTIGNDSETAKEIEKTGATHVNCAVDDFITDRENKIVTTPAYMYDASPIQVFTGIRKAIKELVEMS
jgi:enhancing lycopene biosynthesis protein 2